MIVAILIARRVLDARVPDAVQRAAMQR
jgi:hypothetical protein